MDNYLLGLQREYISLINFCFDDQFYPDVLGHLHPSIPSFHKSSQHHSESRRLGGRLLPEQKTETRKKSLLIELKRSNRRDFLLCEIIGMIAEIVSKQYHFAVLD